MQPPSRSPDPHSVSREDKKPRFRAGFLTLSALSPFPERRRAGRPPDLPRIGIDGNGEGAPLPAFGSSRGFVKKGVARLQVRVAALQSHNRIPGAQRSGLHEGSPFRAAPMGDLQTTSRSIGRRSGGLHGTIQNAEI